MRPLTQRQWRFRFAAAFIKGTPEPEQLDGLDAVVDHVVRQVSDAIATAASVASDLAELFVCVWFWPSPEDEAAYELECRQLAVTWNDVDEIRGEGFVLVGRPTYRDPVLGHPSAIEPPEHMLPPFILSKVPATKAELAAMIEAETPWQPAKLADADQPDLVIENDAEGRVYCVCGICAKQGHESYGIKLGVFGTLPDDLGQMRGGKVTG